MSDKITLTPDQIVSRKPGWITYIDDKGTQRKGRAKNFVIQGEMPPHVEAAIEKGPTPSEEKEMASAAKKKAKAAKKSTGGNGSVRTIGGKAFDLSKYDKVKAPGGGVSYNNGDQVATMLHGKDLDAVYKLVAQKTKVDEKELRSKYKSLNVGMQRMNLGNRLRKVLMPKAA